VVTYWYLRLRGWEIDDVNFGRHSYGNSYALPAGRQAYQSLEELAPILSKLVEKMGFRLRKAGYVARGIHIAVTYRSGGFWHKGLTLAKEIFDSREIYKKALRILAASPYKKPVRDLAVSCFNLRKNNRIQLELFDNVERTKNLVTAIDKVNERWGNFVITPARMLMAGSGSVPDRIAFGGVKELEEFTLLG
jgi:hypothetical protein